MVLVVGGILKKYSYCFILCVQSIIMLIKKFNEFLLLFFSFFLKMLQNPRGEAQGKTKCGRNGDESIANLICNLMPEDRDKIQTQYC